MKGKLFNIILVLMLLAGLALMLYPIVSDYYNSYLQSRIIVDYANQVNQMEEALHREQLEAARIYNESLAENRSQTPLSDEQREIYNAMLSTTDEGIMAYVEIPSISVTLPIAHGTSEQTLQRYVGHLEWSSLPIGGENTHCVISGHRGLPSAELFTNIDHLAVGDRFSIHVLGDKLDYIVDNIAVVEPYDYSLLTIQDDKDYVTLVTCTPYGINSHRLLVRGIRVEGTETPELNLTINNETSDVDLMVLIPLVLAVLVVIVFAVLLIDSSKRKGKGGKHEK
jgi:sortase A